MRLAARLAARGGQEVRVPARVGNSRLLKPSRQASSVKCGARSSRKRRAAAGSGAAQRSRGSLDATRARGRAPPTTGSRVGRLGLGRPQPLVRHHTRSQLLAVYGAGVSRGGLEGARYERTTPQTVWEPGRPFQWFGLRAPLVRSTRIIGVLDSHRYKVVLGLAQLGGPPSGRVGPWRSGDCKSSFPDTFEPERIRTTQCEGVQLWQ